MKILFICKGNVGRSQMAEFLAKKIYADKNSDEFISAGIKISGAEEPIGNLMPGIKEVLDVMLEEGVDVSGAIRKQLTEEMVNNSDKIVTLLEEGDELPEYLANSPKLLKWIVGDPKGKDLNETRKIKDQIKLLISNITI